MSNPNTLYKSWLESAILFVEAQRRRKTNWRKRGRCFWEKACKTTQTQMRSMMFTQVGMITLLMLVCRYLLEKSASYVIITKSIFTEALAVGMFFYTGKGFSSMIIWIVLFCFGHLLRAIITMSLFHVLWLPRLCSSLYPDERWWTQSILVSAHSKHIILVLMSFYWGSWNA